MNSLKPLYGDQIVVGKPYISEDGLRLGTLRNIALSYGNCGRIDGVDKLEFEKATIRNKSGPFYEDNKSLSQAQIKGLILGYKQRERKSQEANDRHNSQYLLDKSRAVRDRVSQHASERIAEIEARKKASKTLKNKRKRDAKKRNQHSLSEHSLSEHSHSEHSLK
jgi:hypothetical protein